jgi:hypothetical protein
MRTRAAGLVALKTISDDTQRESLHMCDRFVLRRAIGEHARQLDDLSQPTAVGLKLGLYVEIHRHCDHLRLSGWILPLLRYAAVAQSRAMGSIERYATAG